MAALASLSRPLRGEPVAAFLLGFLTLSVSPFSWVRARPPYDLVMLALSVAWGLACALLAESRELGDSRALSSYAILILTWWFGLVGLMD